MQIFKGIYFNVNQNVFLDVFKNPDKGFGYIIKLDEKELSELQIETLNYLVRCHELNLLGSFSIYFNTDAVGEINEIERRVEKIEYKNKKYHISADY